MKIALASDHAGFDYKRAIHQVQIDAGHDVVDCGTHSTEPVDYPDFIRPAAEAVARGEFDRAVVFGGSGNGEAMAANRVRGVRCALCWNLESAELARRHNDSNVLSIGERMVTQELAIEILHVWMQTPFDGGRHLQRIRKLDEPPAAGCG